MIPRCLEKWEMSAWYLVFAHYLSRYSFWRLLPSIESTLTSCAASKWEWGSYWKHPWEFPQYHVIVNHFFRIGLLYINCSNDTERRFPQCYTFGLLSHQVCLTVSLKQCYCISPLSTYSSIFLLEWEFFFTWHRPRFGVELFWSLASWYYLFQFHGGW